MTYEGRTPPYPLFIYLDGQPVLVVGAGEVAERKIATLLDYGARVRVVAPEATERVRAWGCEGAVSLDLRPFASGDCRDALLVVAATSNEEVNRAVHAEASAQRTLVNVVDVPALCTCIVPSIMRRGQLQVAVSTAGAAPSVARRIRASLERQYPDYWERYIDLLGEVRLLVKERVPGEAARRTPLFEALGAAGIEGRLAAGERLSAEDVYREVVEPVIRKADQ
ncbi:bifunctional precorrin-2 dehydrogenase/sirohydrochlorin ferrochelatase [Eggerthellaceae bacterium zg-997]|nr:bifunctional precorrin-2 dehydrogenase/sirohydrochlorin ferrochelatase [Eggerthellaceae bacterium zg-997]